MCMHENVIIKVRPLYASQKFILKMEKNGIAFLTREEQSSERTLLGGGGEQLANSKWLEYGEMLCDQF